MASIDKIYGNSAQYDEFYQWAAANRRQILKYFYPKGNRPAKEQRPIANLPEGEDNALLEVCDIGWVTDYIRFQYGK